MEATTITEFFIAIVLYKRVGKPSGNTFTL